MPAAKKTKLYSITVSGQGDTHVSLVTKEVWDWIHDPLNKPLPKDVVDYHYEEEIDDDDHSWTPHVSNTKGKPNGCTVNDAALQAAPALIGGERASFCRMREYTKFVQKHNIEVVDEWEGYIY